MQDVLFIFFLIEEHFMQKTICFMDTNSYKFFLIKRQIFIFFY